MAKKAVSATFEATLTRPDEMSGWHFLVIDSEIANRFPVVEKSRRVVLSMNGSEGFQCALMPSGGTFYIIVNKKKREQLGIEAGDIVNVTLTEDTSKYGLPMPEEFEAVLEQDDEGSDIFHSLTMGKQRSIIYQVSKPKDIDERIRIALIYLEHLKDNGGRVVYEKLKAELKRPAFDM